MIKIENYPILNNNISTLKETSKDNANEEYMVDSLISVVDFDKVKSEYLRKFKLGDVLKSNDALFISEYGNITFIEFKNGDLSKRVKVKALKEKIPDSLLILLDIIDKTVSFARNNIDYILVYNETKNPDNQNNNEMKISKNRTRIAHDLFKLANKKPTRFNLGIYEKLFFNKVYTYDEEEFKKDFIEKTKQNQPQC